jgi:hypothetical protein
MCDIRPARRVTRWAGMYGEEEPSESEEYSANLRMASRLMVALFLGVLPGESPGKWHVVEDEGGGFMALTQGVSRRLPRFSASWPSVFGDNLGHTCRGEAALPIRSMEGTMPRLTG